MFDPLSRLASSTVSGATTRYQYAGVQLATEYDAAGAVTRRYVPGLGLDGVVTAYTGSGTTTRDWLLADERGSVVALTGGTGVVGTINRYDEYGVPHTGNAGRFGYTGQAWMAEAAAWNYRARAYLPGVGRFVQTDPIGYQAGANLYGYVGADPVNLVDPLGLQDQPPPIRPPGVTVDAPKCFWWQGCASPHEFSWIQLVLMREFWIDSEFGSVTAVCTVPSTHPFAQNLSNNANVVSAAQVNIDIFSEAASLSPDNSDIARWASTSGRGVAGFGTAITVTSEYVQYNSEIREGVDWRVAGGGVVGRQGSSLVAGLFGAGTGALLGLPAAPETLGGSSAVLAVAYAGISQVAWAGSGMEDRAGHALQAKILRDLGCP